jgi:hypothetical protein
MKMSNNSDSEYTILDYIDNITVPGNPFLNPANEYWALVCFRQGMDFLYRQALRCDQVEQKALNNDNRSWVFNWNHSTLDTVSQKLLTCSFHWYSISACQYVQTVGAIARRQDPSRPLPKEYAETVIPEVLLFRNKVSAHLAWSTQNRRDNDAERFASVMPPLCFNRDTFSVGDLTFSMTRSGQHSDSEEIKPWSLCKVHEALCQRYWPAQVDSQVTK